MIIYVFVGLLAIILFLEFAVSPRASGHLLCKYGFDTKLAEPGETIVCTGRLLNDWFLPVSYIFYADYMPEGAVVEGTKSNRDQHRLFLLPRQVFRHTVSFSLPKRGVYKKIKYYLQTGDFLGFKSYIVSEEYPAGIVIMPKRCEDEEVLNTLGGYVGDVSVRRFILEDPVLTIGYREYTGREPMKQIDWNQSAKTGGLMVRNNDYTVETRVAVVLNLACGSEEEKEKSLEILRTVCEELEENRIAYAFLTNGDVGELEEGFGRMHFNALMRDLGRSGLFAYSSFEQLADRCVRERKDGRSYILVTPPLREGDRPALGRLREAGGLCLLEARTD